MKKKSEDKRIRKNIERSIHIWNRKLKGKENGKKMKTHKEKVKKSVGCSRIFSDLAPVALGENFQLRRVSLFGQISFRGVRPAVCREFDLQQIFFSFNFCWTWIKFVT